MLYYHATSIDKINEILDSGYLFCRFGLYMCPSYDDCSKFMFFREDSIFVYFELDIPEDHIHIEESFDHNVKFWKNTRCFVTLDKVSLKEYLQSVYVGSLYLQQIVRVGGADTTQPDIENAVQILKNLELDRLKDETGYEDRLREGIENEDSSGYD